MPVFNVIKNFMDTFTMTNVQSNLYKKKSYSENQAISILLQKKLKKYLINS